MNSIRFRQFFRLFLFLAWLVLIFYLGSRVSYAQSPVHNFYFPIFFKGEKKVIIEPDPIPQLDTLKLEGQLPANWQFYFTMNEEKLPPTKGVSWVYDSNEGLIRETDQDQPVINMLYHPEINKITQYRFAESRFFEVLNPDTFEVERIIKAPSPYEDYLDLHDVKFSPNGDRVALMLYKPTELPVDVSGIFIPVVDFVLIEMNWPEMDTIYLYWSGLDNWDVADSTWPIDTNPDSYDAFHVNSLDYHPDPNRREMLISNRHFNEVININLDTGEIIWRLGGPHSDFTFVNDDGFSYQHTAEWTNAHNILIFDNANLTGQDTRIVEYELDYDYMEANKQISFFSNGYALAQGGVYEVWGNQGIQSRLFLISWGMVRRDEDCLMIACPLMSILDWQYQEIARFTYDQGLSGYAAYRLHGRPLPNYLTNDVDMIE